MIEEPIHQYFGLSYANYLVMPRSVLQSMPDEWQKNLVELLEQIPEMILEDFEPKGGYHVQARNEDRTFVPDPYSNYERGRRRLTRITPNQRPLSVRREKCIVKTKNLNIIKQSQICLNIQ